jgi:hypothetical protein
VAARWRGANLLVRTFRDVDALSSRLTLFRPRWLRTRRRCWTGRTRLDVQRPGRPTSRGMARPSSASDRQGGLRCFVPIPRRGRCGSRRREWRSRSADGAGRRLLVDSSPRTGRISSAAHSSPGPGPCETAWPPRPCPAHARPDHPSLAPPHAIQTVAGAARQPPGRYSVAGVRTRAGRLCSRGQHLCRRRSGPRARCCRPRAAGRAHIRAP